MAGDGLHREGGKGIAMVVGEGKIDGVLRPSRLKRKDDDLTITLMSRGREGSAEWIRNRQFCDIHFRIRGSRVFCRAFFCRLAGQHF